MLIIDTKDEAAAKVFGRIVCTWEDEAALDYLRKTLYKTLRKGIEDARAAGMEIDMPDEDVIQGHVDKQVTRVLEFVVEHAAKAFAQAQAKLITDATWLVLEQTMGKQIVRENRNEIAALLNRQFNERIGVRRGRQAGQKDSKPREVKRKTEEHRKAILAATCEIGREPIRRKQVAEQIGVSVKTLTTWVKEIAQETGEELDDLIAIALKGK